MGLSEDIQNIVQDVLQIGGPLDNIPRLVTYKSATVGAAGTYDPSTQTFTRSETTGSPQVPAVEANFRRNQIDGINILPKDKLYLIASNDLIDAGITITNIKPDDRILDGDVHWSVVDVLTDPVVALQQIQLRKP